MKSDKEIVKAMLNDMSSYGEYVEEWLEGHLERNPSERISWSAWFEGAVGKALDDADRGIVFNGWHNQEYRQEIKRLLGREPVKMTKSKWLNLTYSIVMENKNFLYTTLEEREADFRKAEEVLKVFNP